MDAVKQEPESRKSSSCPRLVGFHHHKFGLLHRHSRAHPEDRLGIGSEAVEERARDGKEEEWSTNFIVAMAKTVQPRFPYHLLPRQTDNVSPAHRNGVAQ